MSAQPLKGPWTLGFDPIPFEQLVGSEGGWAEISSPEHGGFALVVWRMEDDERSPQLEATAHLMAAARELLEALEALLGMDVAYQRGPRVEAAVAVGRAAIAKAKGEQR